MNDRFDEPAWLIETLDLQASGLMKLTSQPSKELGAFRLFSDSPSTNFYGPQKKENKSQCFCIFDVVIL